MINKNNPIILVKRIVPDAKLPVRALPTDSGFDVFVQDIMKVYDRSSEEQDPTE